MLDAFAALHAGDDAVLFRESISGDNEGDVVPDGFPGGVAENALGRGVPTSDDAVEVFADDDVVGRVHERTNQAPGFNAVAADETVGGHTCPLPRPRC